MRPVSVLSYILHRSTLGYLQNPKQSIFDQLHV